MPATVVTGLQWGDEGKGKMVDHLAGSASAVARFSGGANAGHTIESGGERIALHQLPSGLLRKDVLGIIGAGGVLDPVALAEEIESLEEMGYSMGDRLIISGKVHLVHPSAKRIEAASEKGLGKSSVGTTGRGIGPTYVRKFRRRGLRLEDAAVPQDFKASSSAITEECIRELQLDDEAAENLRQDTLEFNEMSLN
ncbi:MAG: adenylosuccinate synthase, partial [Candidatus Aegiribacteria sp.]|nr:adenylosuccinate synthase [Candidatus Aegiribacteria sp.]MBD3294098.1 adenylosuccinate synthase [Candidatus Fermentibacteria bacterium]